MIHRAVVFLLVFCLPLISADLLPPANYQSAVGNCLVELRKVLPVTQSLDNFVGTGWDNLRNVHTLPVLHHTFHKCLTTPEGTYLIPDNVIVIPVQTTQFDQMATYHESFTSYSRSVSNGINNDRSFGLSGIADVSGSFSHQHQTTKLEMATISSNLLITQMKAHVYTLLANVNSGLDADLKDRLVAIVELMRNNATQAAMYEAQLIVRDYGTHYVSQADVGLIAEQYNYVSSDIQNQTELDEMKATASAGFHAYLFPPLKAGSSVGTGKNVTEQMQKRLSTITRHVRINTQGGPSAQRLSSCQADNNTTCAGVIDNLVALDHGGEPLFAIVTTHLFNELLPTEVYQLADLLKDAITEYYKRNTIPGCTDAKDSNFNFQANHNDGTCNGTQPMPPFGGVYQICQPGESTCPPWRCDQFTQKNSITGAFSCPVGFRSELVLEFVYAGFEDRVVEQQTKNCHHIAFFKKCKTNTQHIVYKDTVRLISFSCVATGATVNDTDPGYLFGGLYSPGNPNQWTNAESCPPYYFPAKMAGQVSVCLSRDLEMGDPYKVPLNGIYSCQTEESKKKCPDGYSAHLATIAGQCEVYYCIQTGVYKHFDLAQLKRPPFLSPTVQMSNVSEHYVRYFESDELLISYPLQVVLDDSIQNETEQSRFMMTATTEDINEIVAEWIQQKLVDIGDSPPEESTAAPSTQATTLPTQAATLPAQNTTLPTENTTLPEQSHPKATSLPKGSSVLRFWANFFILYAVVC